MKNILLCLSVTILAVFPLTPGSLAEPCRDDGPPPELSSKHSLGDGQYHAIASRDDLVYACVKDSNPNPKLKCYRMGGSLGIPPTMESWLSLPTSASRIVLRDDYAVLSMGSLGLGLVDISTPDILPSLSLTATGDLCRDVALLGTDHIVTAEWSALRVYDMQDPASPDEIAGITLTQARTVAVAGDYAFVACGNLGLAVIDVSNPSMPSFVTQFPVGGFVDQVAAEGTRVYLSGYLLGLVTVDVTLPASPSVVGTLALAGEAEAIALRDGYAYITVGEAVTVVPELPDFDAMALVRLNPTGTPAVVDYYFPTENYSAIAVGDDRVLIGEFESVAHLTLAALQCPDLSDVTDTPVPGLSLGPPWPNPFNPRVNVRFSLPVDVAGRLRVHDLRGNLVAEIWRGRGSDGELTAVWNGTDSSGRTCPSGTYGFVLSDQDGRVSSRVTGTLLR